MYLTTLATYQTQNNPRSSGKFQLARVEQTIDPLHTPSFCIYFLPLYSTTLDWRKYSRIERKLSIEMPDCDIQLIKFNPSCVLLTEKTQGVLEKGPKHCINFKSSRLNVFSSIQTVARVVSIYNAAFSSGLTRSRGESGVCRCCCR